jgi:hypothetical protein
MMTLQLLFHELLANEDNSSLLLDAESGPTKHEHEAHTSHHTPNCVSEFEIIPAGKAPAAKKECVAVCAHAHDAATAISKEHRFTFIMLEISIAMHRFV